MPSTTADTLAVPIIPIGVTGIGRDGAVILQGCKVQEDGHLVVTLEVLYTLIIKGPRAVAAFTRKARFTFYTITTRASEFSTPLNPRRTADRDSLWPVQGGK